MKTHEFEDAVYYRIACDCCDPDHDLHLEVEGENGIVTVLFSGNLEAWAVSDCRQPNFFRRLWLRFKVPFMFFIRGYTEVFKDMVILRGEHIDSFIETLQEAKKHLGGENG